MFTNILTKILAGLDVVLLVVVIIMYIKINTLNSTIEENNLTIGQLTQNNQALFDKNKMQADSLQLYALFVTDLQKIYKNKTSEYNILASKYKIAIDSIKILNKPAQTQLDSNSIIVVFKGKEGKISYKGKTTYFKLTGNSTYTIDISVDTTEILSRIFADENNIIKNEVYADGNLIIDAETKIDSSIYRLIYKSTHETDESMGIFDRIKAVLELNQRIIYDGKIYKADEFNAKVGVKYLFNKNIELYGNKNILNKGYDVGIQFTPSIKDLTNLIF